MQSFITNLATRKDASETGKVYSIIDRREVNGAFCIEFSGKSTKMDIAGPILGFQEIVEEKMNR
ncbi:hypothetical protein PI125_g15466 [Phytophthora idaei]|nr:hypothetical protein PI125_g15466 [Phytophthora idaei]